MGLSGSSECINVSQLLENQSLCKVLKQGRRQSEFEGFLCKTRTKHAIQNNILIFTHINLNKKCRVEWELAGIKPTHDVCN